MERLASLKRVNAITYEQSFLQDVPESEFDLVWSLHVFYYIKSCTEGIQKAVKMAKDSGKY